MSFYPLFLFAWCGDCWMFTRCISFVLQLKRKRKKNLVMVSQTPLDVKLHVYDRKRPGELIQNRFF